MRFGVIGERRAIGAGTNGSERADVQKPNPAPGNSPSEILRCLSVARVELARRKRLRHARKMDHGACALEGIPQTLTGNEVTEHKLSFSRQRERMSLETVAADQASQRLPTGADSLDQMAPDETGSAGDQNHYCA